MSVGSTFDVDLFLYFILECFAPARLTRVIAQASLGSPACLCGFACWVGGWDFGSSKLLEVRKEV